MTDLLQHIARCRAQALIDASRSGRPRLPDLRLRIGGYSYTVLMQQLDAMSEHMSLNIAGRFPGGPMILGMPIVEDASLQGFAVEEAT